MAADLIVRHLMRVPLLQGLTLQQLKEIAKGGERVSYSPGAVIIEQNAAADASVLIVAGEAARVSGPALKERTEPVVRGSLLGETAMLVETDYGSTVVARSHVHVLRINRDKLHAQMAIDPAIAEQIVRNLGARLRHLAGELRDIDTVLAGEETRQPPSGTTPCWPTQPLYRTG